MFTDELVLIVLGSEIEKFDGLPIKLSHDNSHIASIVRIAHRLDDYGFDIGYYDDEHFAIEAAYQIMKRGHIIFLNASNELGYLKLPKTLTEKQYKFLESIKDELKQWDLYEQRINPENEETIVSTKHIKTYEVDRSKYTIK